MDGDTSSLMVAHAAGDVLLAIDLGTSSVKVGVFAPTGQVLAFSRRPYPLTRPAGRDGWAEQDPDAWWAAIAAAVGAVLAGVDRRRLRAVCAGGQGPTLVLVDAAGHAVRPAISWLDSRAEPQRVVLSERLGYPLTPYALLPKLAWLAEHEPERLARARWALQAWDFVGCRLAGGPAVASTFAGESVWHGDWLEAAGLAADPLIPPHASLGSAYARTGGPWAEALGIPAGIPVVAGVNDGTGSMLGAGGGVAGRATDPGGSSGGLVVCADQPLAVRGLFTRPAFRPGTYVVDGSLAASGAALEWWARVTDGAIDRLLALAAQAPAGAAGLVFTPFLAGERAPYWDPNARGAFLGLTFAHGPGHLARAVVESAGFALRLLTERVVAAGGRIDELRVSGEQAGSALVNQVKADVTGVPVSVPALKHVALMGDAIAAAVGAGFYVDLVAAAEAMVQVAERRTPDPATRAVYDQLFQVYSGAYAAMRPLWPSLHTSPNRVAPA